MEDWVERWCQVRPLCCCYVPCMVLARCVTCCGILWGHLARKFCEYLTYVGTRLHNNCIDLAFALAFVGLGGWAIFEMAQPRLDWTPSLRG